MLAFNITQPIPMHGQIQVSSVTEQTTERIPFDVNELFRTPLSNVWRLCYVPSDQIEPISSDWYQISPAAGIYNIGNNYGIHRVAVDDAYLPWLGLNFFKFELVLDPTNPLDIEARIHGKWVAKRNADTRFYQDALKAISSGRPGLDLCYLNCALVRHQIPLECALLKHELEYDSRVCAKLAQCLLFIALNLLDDYDTTSALALLGKNEHELLQGLWVNLTELSTYHSDISLANFETRPRSVPNSVILHILSLFRYLVEFAGGKMNKRQHRLLPEYTANQNANIYGSAVNTNGSKPFGIFDPEKMRNALSKSLVFPDDIGIPDIMELRNQMLVYLPMGFPDGYLDIPIEVLSKLGYDQVKMIRIQLTHFYYEHPSLLRPKNDILVLLARSSLEPMANQVLAEWAVANDGLSAYQRIARDLQDSQTLEQLGLTLAALLNRQRLLPHTPNNNNQPTKGSFQVDFDLLLNGQHVGNERVMFERMIFSVLRVFYTGRSDEKPCQFLTMILDTTSPAPDPFDDFLDQYWVYRIEERLTHEYALEMAELWDVTEKLAVGDEKEIVMFDDNEDEKEAPEAASTGGCWVMIARP
ncbi:hypothetical protein B0O99DRAFT_686979 [Bisporella sp. PMI_857]|nr:hypothetical protein B0O99DRAFT_686979 [Bisporella sp. PMI_857]